MDLSQGTQEHPSTQELGDELESLIRQHEVGEEDTEALFGRLVRLCARTLAMVADHGLRRPGGSVDMQERNLLQQRVTALKASRRSPQSLWSSYHRAKAEIRTLKTPRSAADEADQISSDAVGVEMAHLRREVTLAQKQATQLRAELASRDAKVLTLLRENRNLQGRKHEGLETGETLVKDRMGGVPESAAALMQGMRSKRRNTKH